eukprot:TRINITY_DN43533_c0_g1_i1.p1 TRINITY_DN43533_c0_g1~~TRINITY_DN43533_c0_g1_i1.p1  ORF type:complete len:633 (-),score=93.79 TRINITY_DN43533_c0_g1_i1:216-2114(-)
MARSRPRVLEPAFPLSSPTLRADIGEPPSPSSMMPGLLTSLVRNYDGGLASPTSLLPASLAAKSGQRTPKRYGGPAKMLTSKSQSLPALNVRDVGRRVAWPSANGFLELTDGIQVVDHMRRIPETENRGIMVGQVQSLIEFLKSRTKLKNYDSPLEGWCDKETGTQLTLRNLNHYHLNDFVIIPMTLPARCSYVEAVAFSLDGQIPSWFVSHWWGMPVVEAFSNLRAHACLRSPESCGVTTAYWVCTFAVTQHGSSWRELPPDPRQFDFFRALLLCQGVLVLVDSGRPGGSCPDVFNRTWCVFEVSVATYALNHLWMDMAAVDETGEVQVLTEGLTQKEKFMDNMPRDSPWQESGRTTRLRREEGFPVRLLRGSLEVDLRGSVASSDADKLGILKAVVGHDAEEENKAKDLDLQNPLFEAVNKRLRAKFAQMALRTAIQQRIDISDTGEMPLAKAIREDSTSKVIDINLTSCWQLDDSDMRILATCVPQGGQLRQLNMNFTSCYRVTSVSDLLQSVAGTRRLQEVKLDFSNCTGLGYGGEFTAFAKGVMGNTSMRKLDLNFQGCHDLAGAVDEAASLMKAIPHLTDLRVLSPDCIDIGVKRDAPQPKVKVKPKPKAKWKSVTAQLYWGEGKK